VNSARALARLDTLPQGSRREFHRGTLLAALGRHAEALDPLRQAYDEAGVPELLNNFGVVLARLVERLRRRRCLPMPCVSFRAIATRAPIC
jgi:hypothetical protein